MFKIAQDLVFGDCVLSPNAARLETVVSKNVSSGFVDLGMKDHDGGFLSRTYSVGRKVGFVNRAAVAPTSCEDLSPGDLFFSASGEVLRVCSMWASPCLYGVGLRYQIHSKALDGRSISDSFSQFHRVNKLIVPRNPPNLIRVVEVVEGQRVAYFKFETGKVFVGRLGGIEAGGRGRRTVRIAEHSLKLNAETFLFLMPDIVPQGKPQAQDKGHLHAEMWF